MAAGSSSSDPGRYPLPPFVAPRFEGPYADSASAGTSSEHGVRQADAAADVTIAAFMLPTSGPPLCSQLCYNSRMTVDGQLASHDMGYGNGWIAPLTPYLCQDESMAAVVFTPNVAYWFDRVNNTYRGCFGAKQTLSYQSASHTFTLAMPDGTLWRFFDFAQVGALRGALKSLTTPAGVTMTVTAFTDHGHVKTIAGTYVVGSGPSAVMTTDRVRFSYLNTGAAGAEQVASIRWTRQLGSGAEATLWEQRHTYYGTGNPYGNLGDLKTAALLTPDGSGTTVVRTYYMRYYTGQAGGAGYPHGLMYCLSPAAVSSLADEPQFQNFDAADESMVAQHADLHLEYGTGQRVTKSITDGGAAVYLFGTVESQHADGYNHWRTKTTETRPGGGQLACFSNHIQQPMLTDLDEGGQLQCFRYDDGTGANQSRCAALQVLHAEPSAVVSYNENQADLGVVLRANSGTLRETTYYDDNGQAPGYVHQRIVKQGTAGPPQVEETLQYTTEIINGVTVYRVVN